MMFVCSFRWESLKICEQDKQFYGLINFVKAAVIGTPMDEIQKALVSYQIIFDNLSTSRQPTKNVPNTQY